MKKYKNFKSGTFHVDDVISTIFLGEFVHHQKNRNGKNVVKKILETDEPFIKSAILIDNGYYILEYTPIDKLYNARAFIDKELNTISYYFDISLGNGLER